MQGVVESLKQQLANAQAALAQAQAYEAPHATGLTSGSKLPPLTQLAAPAHLLNTGVVRPGSPLRALGVLAKLLDGKPVVAGERGCFRPAARAFNPSHRY